MNISTHRVLVSVMFIDRRILDSMRWFSHRRPQSRTAPERVPHFFVFCSWWPWPLTPKFELGRHFCTVHLTAKFHRPTFNTSEVIVLTNRQTNKQTPLKMLYVGG